MGTMLRVSPLFTSQELVFRSKNGTSIGGVTTTGRAVMGQFLRPNSCCSSCCCVSMSMFLGPSRSGIVAEIDVLGLGGMVGRWKSQRAFVRRWERMRRVDRVSVRAGEDKNENKSGDDQVETLFMKELRRRGMYREEQDGSLGSGGTDTKTKEEESAEGGPFGSGWSLPGTSKTRNPPPITQAQRDEQLKRSMALNSEGLEGLIPRTTELVKLGGSLFLVFWPFILASLASFFAIYLYFGAAFIHTGNLFERVGRPPYVDPYQLLEEEVIPPQIGPDRVPYNTRIDREPSS